MDVRALAQHDGVAFGAKWYDSAGKTAFGSDPAWLATVKWNKALVDFYGYTKLQKWFAKAGGDNSEYAPQNVFEVGKVAMQVDGEWRVQFIIDDKATVPYATAPFPVADAMADQYGIGEVAGTVIGIPKNAPHAEAAWKFVRFVRRHGHGRRVRQPLRQRAHHQGRRAIART